MSVSIGSDNGLLPIVYQTIVLTNAGLLSIGPLGTNFSEILIKIQNFSFTKRIWKYCPWNGSHFVWGGGGGGWGWDELKKSSETSRQNPDSHANPFSYLAGKFNMLI